MAHLNVNWLAPVKIRQTLIGGSRRMVIYDDMQTSEKVKVYDRGVSQGEAQKPAYEHLVSYRIGRDVLPRAVVEGGAAHRDRGVRPLHRDERPPITDGDSGLRVVELLAAATRSMAMRGQPVDLGSGADGVMIPFLDLPAQYRTIGPDIEAAVLAALRSGNYVLGSRRSSASRRTSPRYCGVRHAVAVNSGTSALHLALLAAGVGPGDEVITVPMTFVATVAAIVYTGATPVFVDIDPATWTMDPALIEAAITSRTKAILPVHLHGRLADMTAISGIARRHGLAVIEDAAQAHGAERDGVRAGAFGDIGCFSFYPGKNLGACGEGGAVTTNDPALAAVLRSLRDWGQEGKYNHVRHGFNFRMDALQGAALGVKLPHLDAWNAARRRAASAYQHGLPEALGRPAPVGEDHACHVYAIRVPDRDAVRERLHRAGIATNIHYPIPVHLQPAYATSATAGGRSRSPKRSPAIRCPCRCSPSCRRPTSPR